MCPEVTAPAATVLPAATIGPDAVAAMQRAGRALRIIDVRTPGEFESLHIAGARSVPLDRIDPADFGRGEPLLLICKSGQRAAKAREKFIAAGFGQVACIDGGTDAWLRAGLPVVRGERAVISIERQVRIGAGTLVVLGVSLGWFVHPVMFGLAAFIGCGLIFAGITDWCGMAWLLARMPWNRARHRSCNAS